MLRTRGHFLKDRKAIVQIQYNMIRVIRDNFVLYAIFQRSVNYQMYVTFMNDSMVISFG